MFPRESVRFLLIQAVVSWNTKVPTNRIPIKPNHTVYRKVLQKAGNPYPISYVKIKEREKESSVFLVEQGNRKSIVVERVSPFLSVELASEPATPSREYTYRETPASQARNGYQGN